MAVALDASTPTRWSGTPANGVAMQMATAFTAPANSFLEVMVCGDSATPDNGWAVTVSDDSGLTWTTGPERLPNETTQGGYAGVFYANAVSSVARKVTVTRSGNASASARMTAKCYVWTGVDIGGTRVDTISANNEGTGSTQTNQAFTALTPGATGVLTMGVTDWNAKGTITSSDFGGPLDTGDFAGVINTASGYQVCSSGVSITGHVTAGAAAPIWKWADVIVRQSAAAGPTAAQEIPALLQAMSGMTIGRVDA